ncbi:hypothetical protein EIN_294620 [Entamoeba invadens IP1]|uniref:Uncharacterized protein n=1 Tax=Entamoeba invadens IP1 TaxID=370355 RepID=L7FN48_ENTIV|nr:hypothetical protein EIN_294620 [Entamoeba invadens IP1]ELP90972.1 hypothetical protein EIN_294620 [Entamoeba invadens IP1]|eukprot:XP_004257743.1 hypothetical protein EIN_294620 [Entamoeba invadens IP1]
MLVLVVSFEQPEENRKDSTKEKQFAEMKTLQESLPEISEDDGFTTVKSKKKKEKKKTEHTISPVFDPTKIKSTREDTGQIKSSLKVPKDFNPLPKRVEQAEIKPEQVVRPKVHQQVKLRSQYQIFVSQHPILSPNQPNQICESYKEAINYDFLLFTQYWPGQICHEKRCSFPQTTEFIEEGFFIHGLWPQFNSKTSLKCCVNKFTYSKVEKWLLGYKSLQVDVANLWMSLDKCYFAIY